MLQDVCLRVLVNTQPEEVVCVTGSTPQLGQWLPSQAVQLKRDLTTTDREVWYTQLTLDEQATEFHYRYFTCLLTDSDEDRELGMFVTRWETNINPRNFSVGQREQESVFGEYDGYSNVDHGWLMGQTEVHLRLHSNPIDMWKPRYNEQKYSVKCTPIDLKYRQDAEDSDDEDTGRSMVHNGVKPVEVSCLSQHDLAVSRLQGEYGVEWHKGGFITFKTQTFQPEFTGFTIDFYVHGSDSDPPTHIGYAYLLPVNFKETFGRKTVPISGFKHRPIGQVTLEYLIIKPILDLPQTMQVSYARHWKKHRRPLDVGHRGMGSSYTSKELNTVRENSIASLAIAGSHGADMVEFDVQLSKDLVPVIYHDFTVCLTMRRKSNLSEVELFQVPVRDLTFDQLQQLQVSHTSQLSNTQLCGENDTMEDPSDHRPFPTLRQAFEHLDSHIGFNIEVKYAMLQRDGEYEENQEHYTERNTYLDIIIKDVLEYAGTRRVIFSCFDPDVCIMLRHKQNKYPVLFLTQALTPKYEPFEDKRTHYVQMAIKFAMSENLLGINVHAEELLADPSLIQQCKDKGLVLFCWGEDNNDSENIKQLKKQGVDGVIYDRISDFKPTKDNVFRMEHEAKMRLLRDVGQLDSMEADVLTKRDGPHKHPLTPRKRHHVAHE